MLSFELKGGLEATENFFSRIKLPIHAASLGGVESLVIRPARSSHLGLTPDERARAGISESLVRMSVGLEGTDDLIADLTQALA
jgi:cystathionine beta-lyase/cystathionine gamma-synthase